MGLCGILIVGQNPDFFEGGTVGAKLIGGGNMVAMHLSKAVGGNLLLGFLAGASLGIAIGALVGLSPWASRLFSPTIQAIRAHLPR